MALKIHLAGAAERLPLRAQGREAFRTRDRRQSPRTPSAGPAGLPPGSPRLPGARPPRYPGPERSPLFPKLMSLGFKRNPLALLPGFRAKPSPASQGKAVKHGEP